MPETLKLDTDAVQCREPIVARYLTMLADCRLLTIESIKSTRADLLYWRRNDFDSNISDLLYHIALVEADWLHTEVREEAIPRELSQQLGYEDRDNRGRLVHIGEEQLDSSLVRLAIVRQKLNDTYSKMDMKEFRRLRQLPKYDVSQHEAEHRGQINLLKRLGTETKASVK
jgi:hypothetical protein